MIITETSVDLIARLRSIDIALSPENLTCDGGLSHTQVLKKLAKLNALRKEIINKLGYEPSSRELYSK